MPQNRLDGTNGPMQQEDMSSETTDAESATAGSDNEPEDVDMDLLQDIPQHPVPYRLQAEQDIASLEEKRIELYRAIASVKAHCNLTDEAIDKLYKVLCSKCLMELSQIPRFLRAF